MWIDMRRVAALSMGISKKSAQKRNFLMFGLNLDRRDGSQKLSIRTRFVEAPNLCWVEVIGSSGDENLTDDAILPARSLLQRFMNPSAASVRQKAAFFSCRPIQNLRDSHRPKLQRQSFLFANRFPFGRDDASRRPRIALRAFPLRRALVRASRGRTARCSAGRLPSHAFSRSAPNDARRHFEALRTHRKTPEAAFCSVQNASAAFAGSLSYGDGSTNRQLPCVRHAVELRGGSLQ